MAKVKSWCKKIMDYHTKQSVGIKKFGSGRVSCWSGSSEEFNILHKAFPRKQLKEKPPDSQGNESMQAIASGGRLVEEVNV